MSSSSSSAPSPWHRIWEEAQPRLRSIEESLTSQSPTGSRIIRIGQLDAELLDQELVQLLLEPLIKALSFVNSAFKSYQAELTLLVQLTLYKFSVWDAGASYGARLQGLKYSAPSTKSSYIARCGLPVGRLLIHGSLTLLVPYLHTRIRAHALSHSWPEAPSSDRRRRAWELLTRLESMHGLLGLVNFVAFLLNGRYRTLAERLLGMRLVPARRLSKRDVSYEFMNRQMVWHAFTEFLLFLLPLINTRALRRRISRVYSQISLSSIFPSPVRKLLGVASKNGQTEGSHVRKGKYFALPLDQCAICYEDAASNLDLAHPSNALGSLSTPTYSSASTNPPEESNNAAEEAPPHPITTPYITSCGHIYCYVCLSSRMMRTADDRMGVGPGGTQWACLRCGEGVTAVERVEMEVAETESEFGSMSMNGVEFDGYDEYGSEDMEFTDMSGSMGSYSESE